MAERITVPFEQFPRKFQVAIKALERPRRGRKRYAVTSVKGAINALGQYLAAAIEAGLPPEISGEGLCLFIEGLDSRGLKNSTRLTYLTAIQALAKETKYPAIQRRLILEDCEIYREAMLREVPKKVRALAAHPITLRDVATAAVKWREIARTTNGTNRRRTFFHRSGVLALLSLLPLRIGDVNRLVIGEHVERTEAGWSLRLRSGKSDYFHNGPLHKSLTPYLDALVYYGCGPMSWPAYHTRVGTPLFGTEVGEFLSSRTLAYNFFVATGHTPHIVRTLVHDALATHGNYGGELARTLCGQTSIQIGKIYEVHAERYRVAQAQKILADLQSQIAPSNQK